MTEDRVRLSLPAVPEYVRFARIVAASLAARLGFSYEEVEDLRLAVDELCHALIVAKAVPSQGAPDRATVELHYTTTDVAIEVEGCLQGGPARGDGVSELARRILVALVDDHKTWPAGEGGPTIWVRKAHSDVARA